MKKIKKQTIAFKNIKKEQVEPRCISFSFKFLDNEKFGYSKEDSYFSSFLQRLCDISKMTSTELRNFRSKAIRSHAVDWSKKSIKDGFSHLSEELQSEAWQFSISSNKHGRVLGFMIDPVFYIVWLDHKHLVYPKQ